eukprot:334518-Rhodomonas_salina.1
MREHGAGGQGGRLTLCPARCTRRARSPRIIADTRSSIRPGWAGPARQRRRDRRGWWPPRARAHLRTRTR